MENDKFENLLKEISRKQRTIGKAKRSLEELLKIRDEECPHTELEAKSYYNGGGYDYTSYSEYWNVCKCCGKSSEITRENHGHYA